MDQRHYLMKGTFLLTITGLLTKAAGFFYKIFLSRTIGAKEIGLFQLTVPVIMFCMAAALGGIQITISRFTAEYYAGEDKTSARRILYCGLFLSVSLSVLLSAGMTLGSGWIASRFLLEPSCAPLLRILSVSLPPAAVHACISSYFMGKKNISVPAASQLAEQLLRIGSVVLFYTLSRKSGRHMGAAVMALGQIAGELSSALFCLGYLFFRDLQEESSSFAPSRLSFQKGIQKTFSGALPLGVNRMLLCILQGIEAALLPRQLSRFGMSSSEALAVYGVLTGMALPLITFPTAITGAVSSLLLPAVSEAQALNQDKKITGTIDAGFHGSLFLGMFFLGAFLLFGEEAGTLLFHNSQAGRFIRKLALLCPFLYINTTLIGILHGLGKTTQVLLFNASGSLIRLAAILFLIPRWNIDGYFAGLLCSQSLATVVSLITLHRASTFRVRFSDSVLVSGLLCSLSGVPVFLLKTFGLPSLYQSFPSLLLTGCLYLALFASSAILLLTRKKKLIW